MFAAVMVRVMMVDSHALLLESSRVCGNLSRYPAVRDILVTNRGQCHLEVRSGSHCPWVPLAVNMFNTIV